MSEKANATDSGDAVVSKEPLAKHPTVAPDGMLEQGTEVEIVQPILKGRIERYHLSGDGKTLTYIVAYTNASGEQHEGSFSHSQLKPTEND